MVHFTCHSESIIVVQISGLQETQPICHADVFRGIPTGYRSVGVSPRRLVEMTNGLWRFLSE